MHIILGILGAIAAFSYWFFVLRNASNAANEVIDAAGRIRGQMKRNAFRKKVEGSPLTSVTDPATAAIVYLTKIAEARGLVSEAARNELLKIANDEMQVADGEELIPFSVWVCQNIVNYSDMLRVFKPLWLENLTIEQRADFVKMAVRISQIDGKSNNEQKLMIDDLRSRLGATN